MPAPLMLAPIGIQASSTRRASGPAPGPRAALGCRCRQHRSPLQPRGDRRSGRATAPRWFQLYWPNDDERRTSFVAPRRSRRIRGDRAHRRHLRPGLEAARPAAGAWLPFLEGIGIANYFQDPVFRAALEQTPEEDLGAAVGHYVAVQVNPSLTWEARMAARDDLAADPAQGHPPSRRRPRGGRARADGIVVSNHGGRQVDGAIAALDALPGIVDAVGERARDPASTAGSAAAPTSSRRWRSAPTPPCSAVPTSGDWPSAARPASRRCCRTCSPSST